MTGRVTKRRVPGNRGGWWLFLVMAVFAVVAVPLMAWLGRGLEAARGLRDWEWRLEGVRRVREAARSLETGEAGWVRCLEQEVGSPAPGVTLRLEPRSGADPSPETIWIRWASPEGAVLLVADFSRDFSDNVRLHDPEILADPSGMGLEEACSRWSPGRDERRAEREERGRRWRALLEEHELPAGPWSGIVSDPAFIRGLAGSFGPEGTTKDATRGHGE